MGISARGSESHVLSLAAPPPPYGFRLWPWVPLGSGLGFLPPPQTSHIRPVQRSVRQHPKACVTHGPARLGSVCVSSGGDSPRPSQKSPLREELNLILSSNAV